MPGNPSHLRNLREGVNLNSPEQSSPRGVKVENFAARHAAPPPRAVPPGGAPRMPRGPGRPSSALDRARAGSRGLPALVT